MVPHARFPKILAYALYALALVVVVAYSAGLVISLYLNAEFGASRIGETGRWLAVLCDVFKIGLSAAILFIPGTAYRLLCLSGIVAFASLSILSSYGYTIQKLETNMSKSRAEKQHYHALIQQKETLQTQLKQLSPNRSPKEIEQRLQVLKRNRIYKDLKRSNKCQNATIAESEVFCARIGKLEVALIQAKEQYPQFKRLNEELSKIKTRLEQINLISINKREDRFALSFGEVDQVNMIFTLFLALLVEITTTASFAIMLVLYQAAGQIRAIKHSGDYHETPVPPKEKQIKTVRLFLNSCIVKDKYAFTLSAHLHAAFLYWCQINRHETLTQKKQ